VFICFTAKCIPLLVQQNVGGFNDSRGNYWLGNELLHQLTVKNSYKLRFDLQDRNLSWYYAEYSSFVVFSESSNYKIAVVGYSGNAGDAFQWYHNNMMFTTYDRDNDPWTDSVYKKNCAVKNGGGFWYKACSYADVNTVRGRGNYFRWWVNGRNTLLQSTRMWLWRELTISETRKICFSCLSTISAGIIFSVGLIKTMTAGG